MWGLKEEGRGLFIGMGWGGLEVEFGRRLGIKNLFISCFRYPIPSFCSLYASGYIMKDILLD